MKTVQNTYKHISFYAPKSGKGFFGYPSVFGEEYGVSNRTQVLNHYHTSSSPPFRVYRFGGFFNFITLASINNKNETKTETYFNNALIG